MKKFKVILIVLAAATTVVSLKAGQRQEKHVERQGFIGLGDLPGGIMHSMATGISADGKVVVGYGHSENGPEAFRWTLEDGMEGLGFQNAMAASGSGCVVVGQRLNLGRSQPVRWTSADGTVDLDPNGEFPWAVAYGVTADGSKAVGVVGTGPDECARHDRAHSWMPRGGVASQLNAADEQVSSVAYGVSADGQVVVGAKNNLAGHQEAFCWTAKSGMRGLGYLPGHTTSCAYAVSADGSVVVGSSSNFVTTTAFQWSEETGMTALRGEELVSDESTACAVSSDGTIIVGYSRNRRGQEAAIWDAGHRVRRVRDLFPHEFSKQKGPYCDWRLTLATAVSADGNVVAGVGINSQGCREAWVARLSEDRRNEQRAETSLQPALMGKMAGPLAVGQSAPAGK